MHVLTDVHVLCRRSAHHLSSVNRALIYLRHHVLREHHVSLSKILLLL